MIRQAVFLAKIHRRATSVARPSANWILTTHASRAPRSDSVVLGGLSFGDELNRLTDRLDFFRSVVGDIDIEFFF